MSHPNRWHRQTAVRLLGERREPKTIMPLQSLVRRGDVHPALEALWALHQMNALDEPTALAALSHVAFPVRAWAVRLLGDEKQLTPTIEAAIRKLAASETAPMVRCQIASTARRLPAAQALPLVSALMTRDR